MSRRVRSSPCRTAKCQGNSPRNCLDTFTPPGLDVYHSLVPPKQSQPLQSETSRRCRAGAPVGQSPERQKRLGVLTRAVTVMQ
jgi:hypothetical protein